MSQAAKEARERELAAYVSTLTPEDAKRENTFRTTNVKDPNAPKKDPSGFFMFLQWLRSDPELAQGAFSDETDATRQTILAAAEWRSMTDDERKVHACPPGFRLVYS